jgi:acyl-CoA synthetase (AMP-forming)/AMP-acid ligase II
MDDDGFIYVVDRIKDMIVSGGENVYSAEVENAIAQLPQVAMCAVIGVPDDALGRDGCTRWSCCQARAHARRPTTLIAHCRTLIAGYKCPRSVDFRDALPLSAAGKMLKVDAARAVLGASASPSTPTAWPTWPWCAATR